MKLTKKQIIKLVEKKKKEADAYMNKMWYKHMAEYLFGVKLILITLLLTSTCLAKINPQDAYDCGVRDGVLKGISISYKTFKGMYKDKKNHQEYLRRLVAEIQAQKVYEGRVMK